MSRVKIVPGMLIRIEESQSYKGVFGIVGVPHRFMNRPDGSMTVPIFWSDTGLYPHNSLSTLQTQLDCGEWSVM